MKPTAWNRLSFTNYNLALFGSGQTELGSDAIGAKGTAEMVLPIGNGVVLPGRGGQESLAERRESSGSVQSANLNK
jgi:hypothetical protein